MTRFYTMILCLMLTASVCTGCLNTDDDYQRQVDEKDALARELARANHENDLLKQAQYNISQEQEKLRELLGARIQSDLPMPTPSADNTGGSIRSTGDNQQAPPILSDTTQPDRERRTYKARPGDTLYTIASKHNTSLEALLEANEFLRQRRNYMIYDTDVLTLP